MHKGEAKGEERRGARKIEGLSLLPTLPPPAIALCARYLVALKNKREAVNSPALRTFMCFGADLPVRKLSVAHQSLMCVI